jgi:alpha-L-rhamnosidase
LEDKPGFEEVAFDPAILPALSPVSAWHDTRFGRIEAGWRLEAGTATCRLSLPHGVTARLRGNEERKSLTANGRPIAPGEEVRLGAGEHTITFTI